MPGNLQSRCASTVINNTCQQCIMRYRGLECEQDLSGNSEYRFCFFVCAITGYMCVAWSLVILLYTCKEIFFVKRSKIGSIFSMVCILALGNVVFRFFTALDPYGHYGIISLDIFQVFVNLGYALSVGNAFLLLILYTKIFKLGTKLKVNAKLGVVRQISLVFCIGYMIVVSICLVLAIVIAPIRQYMIMSGNVVLVVSMIFAVIYPYFATRKALKQIKGSSGIMHANVKVFYGLLALGIVSVVGSGLFTIIKAVIPPETDYYFIFTYLGFAYAKIAETMIFTYVMYCIGRRNKKKSVIRTSSDW